MSVQTKLERRRYDVDVLIVGGGTAGCFAARTIAERSGHAVLIAEKANIQRSGCLAAGVNALNAYITKGKTPQDYVDYAMDDANGIARVDLLSSVAKRFNAVTDELERMGLVILKDENGEYVARGERNIKINGENIKPLLAEDAKRFENVEVLNHINMTDLLVENHHVYGAVGFSMREKVAYEIRAKAVLIATGGAAGLYRPNRPGYSRHKMWYCPFNTGAGYAMGILAGAEMTTFEMRFVALRCKDTIAPTGTIAQGVGAKQVNARGEEYESKYGISTSERIYGTVEENKEGRGPCYLQTEGISEEQEESLLKAYLNMAPEQTLKWVTGKKPSQENVEIEGTEPYIVGGHTASGFWVDTNRRTTLKGLYAAGDAAGGCPQKFVTGVLAEAEIAAEDILRVIESDDGAEDGVRKTEEVLAANDGAKEPFQKKEKELTTIVGMQKPSQKIEEKLVTDDETEKVLKTQADRIIANYEKRLNGSEDSDRIEELEASMQDIMDRYAGGISANYGYREEDLREADRRIAELSIRGSHLAARDMHELLFIYELRERLVVCRTLIAHLLARKETRWHIFGENLDYPLRDGRDYFVNSRWTDGAAEIIFRDMIRGEVYEHSD